jgi:hypothetical protein
MKRHSLTTQTHEIFFFAWLAGTCGEREQARQAVAEERASARATQVEIYIYIYMYTYIYLTPRGERPREIAGT